MSNIFITGTNKTQLTLAKELVAQGFDVRVLAHGDLQEKQVKTAGATPVAGNLSNTQTYIDALKTAEIVFHEANLLDPDFGTAENAAIETITEALKGTKKTFVYTSNTWVLGDTNAPSDESAKVNPIALVAPLAAHEQKVLDLGKSGVRTAIVRQGIVYGYEGDYIQQYTKRTVSEKRATYIGNGDNYFSFIALTDLVELYINIAEQSTATGVFHAVGANPIKSRDFAEIVASAFDIKTLAGLSQKELEVTFGAFAQALSLNQQVISTRGKEKLGWTAENTDLHAYVKEVQKSLVALAK